MQQVANIPVIASVDEVQKIWDIDLKSTAEVIKVAGIKLD